MKCNRVGSLLVGTLALGAAACGGDGQSGTHTIERPGFEPSMGTNAVAAAESGTGIGTNVDRSAEARGPTQMDMGAAPPVTTMTGAEDMGAQPTDMTTPAASSEGSRPGGEMGAAATRATMPGPEDTDDQPEIMERGPIPAREGAEGSGASATDGPPVAKSDDGCTPAPAGDVADYGARGPFDVMTVSNTGPNGQYTLIRPIELGKDGFHHPPVSWGNGITTTPSLYVELLNTVASHGFVVIASNSTAVTAQLVGSGLQWLIEQDASGEFQGALAIDCAATIGYSMGGGAAVGASNHSSVVAVVSWHGLQAATERANGPVLLITSTDDGFVTKSGYVQPTYERSSTQPTIMATLDSPDAPSFAGHLIPLGDAGPERAPAVAWLRYWVYGDGGAMPWFFGPDCTLCQSPWTDIRKKNHAWD
ncbi:MAG: dienelactone hydrolase family protein [Myxococcales bacterium]|nr:dienelactone hydrolase family protein [Myxococcales bacterium]